MLITAGLKVTPQRLAVLEAVHQLKTHPTADQIVDYIREFHPNIAIGTVYKVLDVLVEKMLLRKVKTERDVMRFEAETDTHHHLYCAESDRIEDYHDENLDNLIENYFNEKNIPGFSIKEVKLQIIGTFDNQNNTTGKSLENESIII